MNSELTAQTEDRAQYIVTPTATQSEDEIIAAAKSILLNRMKTPGAALSSPQHVRDYLTLTLAGLEHEVFTCIFLDAQNRLLSAQEMFRGTLTQTSVFPREILKAALARNAGAVIFAHNHPSGSEAQSTADERLTNQLKTALALVDVRVLDHLIVARDKIMSFAELGLI